jgi:hypothetical protein
LREAVSVFLRDRPILQDMRRLALEKAKYFTLERMRSQYLNLMTDAKEIVNMEERKTAV